jgi:hypothetical protein
LTYERERIRALSAECDDQDASNASRGKALESLAVELFSAIPGVRVEPANSLDVFGAQEIDVGIWNEGHPEGLQGFAQIFWSSARTGIDRWGLLKSHGLTQSFVSEDSPSRYSSR